MILLDTSYDQDFEQAGFETLLRRDPAVEVA